MHFKKESYIRGRLAFSRTKVLLIDHDEQYFIKPFSVDTGYLNGDLVEAKIARSGSEGYLAEVIVKKLIQRTKTPIVGRIKKIEGRKMQVEIFREYGSIGKIIVFSEKGDESLDDIIEVRAVEPKGWKITEILGKHGDEKIDEILLYRKEGVRLEFPDAVIKAGEKIERGMLSKKASKTLIPAYIRDGLIGEYFDDTKNPFPSTTLSYKSGEYRERTDFRNWFTMTIDGADAKDLDDAISIARYSNGNYLIGVHIADVAEYVREETELDREAVLRTTSIYTPGRVIPMLPEILSNDLCSLHPGESKLTLSILMKLDQRGEVLATFMTEGVIESRKRGIYEEIKENEEGRMKMEDAIGKVLRNHESIETGAINSGSSPRMTGTLDSSLRSEGRNMDSRTSQRGQENSGKISHLSDFFSLYHILERRRKKEGKIIFESSEPKFSFDAEGKIIDIHQRERGPSHMMIEEFMVLANEEVAKWCTKHSLPFLSRIHHLPPEENAKIIREIVGLGGEDIHPTHIRQFLDDLSTKRGNNIYPTDEKQGSGSSGVETVGAKKKNIDSGAERGGASFLTTETFDTFTPQGGTGGHKSMEDTIGKVLNDHESTGNMNLDTVSSPRMTKIVTSQNTALYKYSRLLLPKMAKAFYSDKAHMHFGLALEYYSHFTSPIRRYPDLQVHRIIKEELHKTLDKKRKEHYRHILKKIAKKCSDGEARATDIERSVDALMICRYMSDKTGNTYPGRVSGLTEWAVFIELESGVDVTVYLSKGREKGRYTYDPVRGTLALGQKVLHTIGDVRQVKITGVNMEDRRVEGELIL